MAAPLRNICQRSKVSFLSLRIHYSTFHIALGSNTAQVKLGVLQTTNTHITSPVISTQKRYLGFLSEVNHDTLWSGVTGVSNAGSKRGRGLRPGHKQGQDKGRVRRPLGSGKANMLWPGLNTPIDRDGKRLIIEQGKEPTIPTTTQAIPSRRPGQADRLSGPLVRGWTGIKLGGVSIGRPDPVHDYTFEGFDTRVLENKTVCNMTATLGRYRRKSVFVVVGNKNGLCGYANGKALTVQAAKTIAKNRAAKNLMYIPLFEGHTGHGLKCHRAIKTICELIGIKNLHVKVEGRTKNMKALTKGFFEALTNQENHQELAERTGYHVVETRKEYDLRPVVVATPQKRPVNTERLRNEENDVDVKFSRYYMGGRRELPSYISTKVPFFHKEPSYKKKMVRVHKSRNQRQLVLYKTAGLLDKHFDSHADQQAASEN